MTLRLQLTLTALILFVATLSGMAAINLSSTRQFLNAQLESHAQDTATSLGLSLSSTIQLNDLVTMARMIDAIFERGYYTEIAVQGNDGRQLIVRKLAIRVNGVPEWFVKLITLETPRKEAVIMSGWRQVASVSVVSHPGYAYKELWKKATYELAWLSVIGGLAMVLGFTALHFILRSLRTVENQAKAIIAREYPVQEKLPWTRDLRHVVEVMNRMSLRVTQMFKEQAALTETLRADSYMDSVTTLGNRRWFRAQMESLIESPEEFYSGVLFFLELGDFKAYNEKHGFPLGDAKLKSVAEFLRTVSDGFGKCVLARSSGANFSLLLPGIGKKEAGELAQKIIDGIRLLHKDEPVHIGIAFFKKGRRATDLFTEADMALRVAQNQEEFGFRFAEGTETAEEESLGADYWRNLLASVVAQGGVLLQFQPVVLRSGELFHQEVLLRIKNEQGEILNAGVFMPMAESLGFSADLDRLVITEALKKMNSIAGRFAINISVQSLLEHSFIDWLEREAGITRETASRLIFELPENEVIRHVKVVQGFIDRMRQRGCEFGIDHCGGGFASFSYLATLKANYLKIDGSYSRKIDTQRNNQFLVQSMAKIAHELSILIIAQSVETENERDTLLKLYVDGLKGYLIGGPVD